MANVIETILTASDQTRPAMASAAEGYRTVGVAATGLDAKLKAGQADWVRMVGQRQALLATAASRGRPDIAASLGGYLNEARLVQARTALATLGQVGKAAGGEIVAGANAATLAVERLAVAEQKAGAAALNAGAAAAVAAANARLRPQASMLATQAIAVGRPDIAAGLSGNLNVARIEAARAALVSMGVAGGAAGAGVVAGAAAASVSIERLTVSERAAEQAGVKAGQTIRQKFEEIAAANRAIGGARAAEPAVLSAQALAVGRPDIAQSVKRGDVFMMERARRLLEEIAVAGDLAGVKVAGGAASATSAMNGLAAAEAKVKAEAAAAAAAAVTVGDRLKSLAVERERVTSRLHAAPVSSVSPQQFTQLTAKLNAAKTVEDVAKVSRSLVALGATGQKAGEGVSRGAQMGARGLLAMEGAAAAAGGALRMMFTGVMMGIGMGALFAMQRAVTGLMFGWMEMSQKAEDLKNLNLKTGVSVQDLQTLQFASEQLNVSFDTVRVGARFLSKQIAASSPILKELGVDAKDSVGNLRPVGDVMLELADLFANSSDETSNMAVAIKLFGRAGAELLPILMLGSKGWKEYAEEMTKTGNRIDDNLMPTLLHLDRRLDHLHAKIAGMQKGIKVAFAVSVESVLGPGDGSAGAIRKAQQSVERAQEALNVWKQPSGIAVAMIGGEGALEARMAGLRASLAEAKDVLSRLQGAVAGAGRMMSSHAPGVDDTAGKIKGAVARTDAAIEAEAAAKDIAKALADLDAQVKAKTFGRERIEELARALNETKMTVRQVYEALGKSMPGTQAVTSRAMEITKGWDDALSDIRLNTDASLKAAASKISGLLATPDQLRVGWDHVMALIVEGTADSLRMAKALIENLSVEPKGITEGWNRAMRLVAGGREAFQKVTALNFFAGPIQTKEKRAVILSIEVLGKEKLLEANRLMEALAADNKMKVSVDGVEYTERQFKALFDSVEHLRKFLDSPLPALELPPFSPESIKRLNAQVQLIKDTVKLPKVPDLQESANGPLTGDITDKEVKWKAAGEDARASMAELQDPLTMLQATFRGLSDGLDRVIMGLFTKTQTVGSAIKTMFEAILQSVIKLLAQIIARLAALAIIKFVGNLIVPGAGDTAVAALGGVPVATGTGGGGKGGGQKRAIRVDQSMEPMTSGATTSASAKASGAASGESAQQSQSSGNTTTTVNINALDLGTVLDRSRSVFGSLRRAADAQLEAELV